MAIRIEPADGDDRADIIEVLATAFADDWPMLALFPDERRRPQAMRRMYALDVTRRALTLGQSLVARDGSQLAGAALAFPPRRPHLTLTADLLAAPRYIRLFGRRVLQAQEMQRAMHAVHPKEPHIYLLYLGAREPGRGVGGALLTALTQDADRQGLPVYLESSTPASARLYARHGFEPRREIVHRHGRFTPMWRPANASVR
ncbi:MAG TPA: GNAT family N-acetyltransferase [Aeromicrobium sp.]|nr:GNAT family N-acetyltransferase [Aeromicrobium sp.]